jgi:drug/metabolite transporter (DMT)-like permease
LGVVVVFFGTLGQTSDGLYVAQERYFRSWFAYWTPHGSAFPVVPLPGGYLLGTMLVINLIVAHFTRFKWTWSKSGIFMTHIGIILLLLGRLLFGDEVGPRRIAASMVGFGGALLVIQPSLAVFGEVALYPLGTSFFFAFYMLITRFISTEVHPVTMQMHTSIAGTLICIPGMALLDGTGIPSLDPVMPQGIEWLWLFGVGFWAAVSHICMTYALKFAPSATLAPLHYVEIVAAVALGYLVFSDFPNAMTWAGIAVIVSSGLYIIHRERIVARGRRFNIEIAETREDGKIAASGPRSRKGISRGHNVP